MNSHLSNHNSKNSNLWILDTDSTYHICFDKTSFITSKTIILVHVTFPDGSHIIVSMFHNVVISPSLTLHNVRYIPSFHVNLISIAKLVSGNNCYVHFNVDTCQILQNHSKKMIGTTKFKIGLYVLSSTHHSFIYNSIVGDTCKLWRLRYDTFMIEAWKMFPKCFLSFLVRIIMFLVNLSILSSSLIWWKSKKQRIVSRYLSEVEYRALTSLTC